MKDLSNYEYLTYEKLWMWLEQVQQRFLFKKANLQKFLKKAKKVFRVSVKTNFYISLNFKNKYWFKHLFVYLIVSMYLYYNRSAYPQTLFTINFRDSLSPCVFWLFEKTIL